MFFCLFVCCYLFLFPGMLGKFLLELERVHMTTCRNHGWIHLFYSIEFNILLEDTQSTIGSCQWSQGQSTSVCLSSYKNKSFSGIPVKSRKDWLEPLLLSLHPLACFIIRATKVLKFLLSNLFMLGFADSCPACVWLGVSRRGTCVQSHEHASMQFPFL